MIKRILQKVLRKLAMEYGKAVPLYFKVCQPNNAEYAEFLRRHGHFYQYSPNPVV